MKCEVRLSTQEQDYPVSTLETCKWGIVEVSDTSVVGRGSPVVRVGSELLFFPKEGLYGPLKFHGGMRWRQCKAGESITITF